MNLIFFYKTILIVFLIEIKDTDVPAQGNELSRIFCIIQYTFNISSRHLRFVPRDFLLRPRNTCRGRKRAGFLRLTGGRPLEDVGGRLRFLQAIAGDDVKAECHAVVSGSGSALSSDDSTAPKGRGV